MSLYEVTRWDDGRFMVLAPCVFLNSEFSYNCVLAAKNLARQSLHFENKLEVVPKHCEKHGKRQKVQNVGLNFFL